MATTLSTLPSADYPAELGVYPSQTGSSSPPAEFVSVLPPLPANASTLETSIHRWAFNLERGCHTVHCLHRLITVKAPLELLHKYKVRQIAYKYLYNYTTMDRVVALAEKVKYLERKAGFTTSPTSPALSDSCISYTGSSDASNSPSEVSLSPSDVSGSPVSVESIVAEEVEEEEVVTVAPAVAPAAEKENEIKEEESAAPSSLPTNVFLSGKIDVSSTLDRLLKLVKTNPAQQ